MAELLLLMFFLAAREEDTTCNLLGKVPEHTLYANKLQFYGRTDCVECVCVYVSLCSVCMQM